MILSFYKIEFFAIHAKYSVSATNGLNIKFLHIERRKKNLQEKIIQVENNRKTLGVVTPIIRWLAVLPRQLCGRVVHRKSASERLGSPSLYHEGSVCVLRNCTVIACFLFLLHTRQ